MEQTTWLTTGSELLSILTVILLVIICPTMEEESPNQHFEKQATTTFDFLFHSNVVHDRPSQQTSTEFPEVHLISPNNRTVDTPTREGTADCEETDFCDGFGNSSDTSNNHNYTYLGAHIETCHSYLCESDSTKCTCDMECLVYQDCCIDFLNGLIFTYAKLLNKTIVSISDIKNHFLAGSNIEKHEFIASYSSCIQTGHNQSTILISKCPRNESIQTDIALKCESELVPVSYIGPDNTLSFKNPYCALCHGVNSKDFTFWDTSLKCSNPIYESDNLTKVLQNCKVSFTTKHINDDVRKCMANASNDFTCESTWRKLDNIYYNLQEICNSYLHPVKHGLEPFRNPHCITCAKNTSNIGTNETCAIMENDDTHGSGLKGSGLKLLFNFIPETGISVTKDCNNVHRKICPIHQVYDCASQTCRLLYCPLYRMPHFGECVARNESLNSWARLTLPVDNNLWHEDGIIICATVIVSGSKVKLFEEMLDESNIIEALNKTGILQDVHSVSLNTTSKNETQDIAVEMQVTLVFLSVRSLFELERLLQRLFSSTKSGADIRVSVRNFLYFESLVCPETKTKEKVTVNITINESDRQIRATFEDIDVDIFNTRFVIEIYPALSNNNSDAYVCLHTESLDCPMVAYNADEFEVSNGVLAIHNTSLSFPNGTYLLRNSKAFVCSNSVKRTDLEFKFFQYSDNQWMLSICTSTVSMIFLLIVVILHCKYSSLRNLHGLNLTALSMNLFLAQGITLLNGLPTGSLCTITGVVTHYLWLSVFVWMSIIGLDMARTFGAKLSSSRAVAGERFRKYLIASVIIPFVLVSVCIAIDFSKTEFRIGYGGNGGICWISNPVALLVFVSVPIGLSICSNVIMFTITVCAIESVKSASKLALTKRNRGYLLVYLKLTVVLGFTWISGFIAAFVRKEVLWYAYIILNGLQGLCIFVCFVLNKRVVGMMRKGRTKSSTKFNNVTMITAPTESIKKY